MRNIVFIIIIFSYSIFSAPNVNLVSPYVIRGFSKTYAISYNPETFTGYYEITPKYEDQSHLSGNDTLKTLLFMTTERFNSIGIKDKAEIGFSLFILPFGGHNFFTRVRFRTAINIHCKGNNNLFANIAISPFIGFSANVEPFVYIQHFPKDHYHGFENFYISHYYGVSIGTRKSLHNKYSFELFVSPSYSFTNYDSYYDITYNTSGNISFLSQSIDIPIGFRYISEKRIVKFSIKSGIGLHFNVNEKRDTDDYDSYSMYATINSSYSYKSSHFSAFAEIGFHFGSRKYNQERRRQREESNFEREV